MIKKVKFNIMRFPSFKVTQGPVSFSGYLSAATYIPPIAPTTSSLSGWGAKGWNLTVPTRPIYQLGVSLVELKDVTRTLTTTMTSLRALRGLDFSKISTTVGGFFHDLTKGSKFMADNYLNFQFGWAPILQDMRFILNYQLALSKKLNWLRKMNGKSVRRKIELDHGSFSEYVGVLTNAPSTVVPPINTPFYADSTSPYFANVTKSVKTRTWYSAKYRFWIPNIPKAVSRASNSLKRQFTGLDLDPSTLYKAYKWTWLLDWFTSVGAVLQNLFNMAKFSVVAEYAYVMCESSFTYDSPAECRVNRGTYSFATLKFPGVLYLRGSSQTIYEFKQREAASPFGFGITLSSLSNFQWSILASLGISLRLR